MAEANRELKLMPIIPIIFIFSILMRIVLHPSNFSPVDAIALFSGAYFARRIHAFLFVILSVWLGDLVLSKSLIGNWTFFYDGFYWQYCAYLFIVLLGQQGFQEKNIFQAIKMGALSAILFFFLSNFGVWTLGRYGWTWQGFINCYIAAIPFFKNTFLSDLFFSVFLLWAITGFSSRRQHDYQITVR